MSFPERLRIGIENWEPISQSCGYCKKFAIFMVEAIIALIIPATPLNNAYQGGLFVCTGKKFFQIKRSSNAWRADKIF